MSTKQAGEGRIIGSAPTSSTTGANGASYCSHNGDNDPTPATPGSPSSGRRLERGKFTLAIDCEGLLMPDVNRPGIFTSKSADDAAQYFQLSTISTVRALYKIKVKCFHTCGPIEFDEGSCLRTLISMGDWFVNEYRGMEISARYETWTNGREGDWFDPDMVLLVIVD